MNDDEIENENERRKIERMSLRSDRETLINRSEANLKLENAIQFSFFTHSRRLAEKSVTKGEDASGENEGEEEEEKNTKSSSVVFEAL